VQSSFRRHFPSEADAGTVQINGERAPNHSVTKTDNRRTSIPGYALDLHQQQHIEEPISAPRQQ
jgi:hypothetical protein